MVSSLERKKQNLRHLTEEIIINGKNRCSKTTERKQTSTKSFPPTAKPPLLNGYTNDKTFLKSTNPLTIKLYERERGKSRIVSQIVRS